MKKLFLSIGFLLPVVASAAFLDTLGHPHETYINTLQDHGIVEGYGSGLYRPDITVNRAEFLKVLMLASIGDEVFTASNTNCFADFRGTEQWYWVYACAAKERGIVDGYPDGTFRGWQTINLVEALKMTTDAWNIDVIPYGATVAWYAPYMDIARLRNMFTVLAERPAQLLTRSDMAALLVSFGEEIQTVSVQKSSSSSSASTTAICGNGLLEEPEQCDDGNLENGDGCSKICVIVPEPVYHGALRLDQRYLSDQNVSRGAKDITLLQFDAIGARQDVKLTGLTFMAGTGSLSLGQNYVLYYDSNGDGTADKRAATASDDGTTITFSPLAITIRNGQGIRMEVRADIRGTAAGSSLGLSFATNQARFVEAVGLTDSRDLAGITVDRVDCDSSLCWIAVDTQEPKAVRIQQNGNLYVTQDFTPVPARQLQLGIQTDTLLRIQMRAEHEDVRLDELRILTTGSSIDSLKLYLANSSTPFATAERSQCLTVISGQFCTHPTLTIPRQETYTIFVKAVLKSENTGGTSGDSIALSLAADTSISPAVRATGLASDAALSQNDGDVTAEGEIFIGRDTAGLNSTITGTTHQTVGGNFWSITNAHGVADNTAVPTGSTAIGTFRFQTAPHSPSAGDETQVTIKSITFSVTATNVQIQAGSFALFNKGNSAVTTSCTESATTGAITVTCSGLESSSVSTVIDQGDAIDLSLRANITNANTSSGGQSTLQVRLQELTNQSAGTVTWTDSISTFQWVDTNESTVNSTVYRS